MKFVFCLMGLQCNGKYETYEYLRDVYHLHPYKTITNRRKTKYDSHNIFTFLSTDKMIEIEKEKDILGTKLINGYHFGKRISTLQEGFNVCITDYEGYKEMKKIAYTVPVLIERNPARRYQDTASCNEMSPEEFLKYDEISAKQITQAKGDKNVQVVQFTTWNNLKVQIDDIMLPYIDELIDYNHIKK